MANIRRRVNSHRSKLNPCDPEYEEPMEPEEEEEDPPFDDDEVWDGPYHYVPPGER